MAPLGFTVTTADLLNTDFFNELEGINLANYFLNLLEGEENFFEFRALYDKDKHRKGNKLRGTLAAMWRELQRLNSLSYGIFFTVNATDGAGVEKKNISRVRAVWHEDDAGGGVAPEFPLPPSVVVQTSPGKFHRYWLVDNMSPEQFAGVMRCMVNVYGGDKNAADIARVLRLPGTLHMKGDAFPVTILEASGKRYTGAELAAAFPAPPEEERPAASQPRPLAPADAREADIMDALGTIPADDRAMWVKIGMALKSEFGERGREIWDTWSATSRKYDPRTQAKAWRSFRSGGVAGNSIFHEAKAYGWRPDRVAVIETDDPLIATFLAKHAGQSAAPLEVRGKTPGRFPLIPYDQIQLDTAPRYIVRDVIPAEGLAVVWGPPKQGKSFWLFDLCMHVARGWEYRGKRVKQGAVVYGCFEGLSGFKARKVAFEREKDKGGPAPFYLLPVPINLVEDYKNLIEAIKSELDYSSPSIIVLDTLNRSFIGSESDDKDMARYIRAADALKCAFSCTVIIVHHSGHDQSRFRGHSSLLGALDCEISVAMDEGRTITSTVELMKDGRAGAEFFSTLAEVELGNDTDGEPITSCVIVEASKAGDKQKVSAPSKLSPAHKLALAALYSVTKQEGREVHAAYIPAGAKIVSIDAWRAECYSRGLGGEKQASKQRAFVRAKEFLLSEGYIVVRDAECWATPGVADMDAICININSGVK